MYRKLRFVLALLHQCLIYLAVLLFLGSFFVDTGVIRRVFFLLIPIVGTWCVGRFMKQVWQLLLIHLACLLLPLVWCQSIMEIVLHETFLAFLLLIHLLEERSPDIGNLVSRPSFFPLALYLLLAYFNGRYQENTLYVSFIVMFGVNLLICFLDIFLRQMSDFVELHRETADMPLGQMEQVNYGLLAGFLTVLAVVLCGIPFTPLGQWLEMIPKIIKQILRHGFGWLFSHWNVPEEGPLEKPEITGISIQASGNEFLQRILEIFGYILIAALVVVAVIVIYRFLTSGLKHGKEDTDQKEFLRVFYKDQRAGTKKEKNQVAWHDFSPSGQIRRIYVREILKAGKKGAKLQKSHTPAQLEQTVDLSGRLEAADLLHEAYEKARYSKDGCEKEEWNQLKKILGR